MKQITELPEIQAFAYEIFLRFSEFCGENGIDYYMAYGTLIGAIRHKGFIPWDDDIDVWVKREDYETIMERFPAWGRERGLYLNSSRTTENYNRIFAKICMEDTGLETLDRHNPYREGFFIDIFVLDGSPNNPVKRFFRVTHLQLLRNLVTLAAYGADQLPDPTAKQKLYGKLSKLLRGVDQAKLIDKYERVASKSPTKGSDLLLIPIRKSKGKALTMPASWFASTLELPFEGGTASVPAGFDGVLRQIFGDYMQLPPEDQRKPGHAAKFYAEEDLVEKVAAAWKALHEKMKERSS